VRKMDLPENEKKN